MKLWGVLEGPWVMEDDRAYFLGKVQMLDNEPEIVHREFYFDDFNAAYNVCKHFNYNITPLSEEDIGRIIKEDEISSFKEVPH